MTLKLLNYVLEEFVLNDNNNSVNMRTSISDIATMCNMTEEQVFVSINDLIKPSKKARELLNRLGIGEG
jgi:hypothetical protein